MEDVIAPNCPLEHNILKDISRPMVPMPSNVQKGKVPVSAIIPCYNCEATISRAVRSVAEQTQKPHELILINDNSQDNTCKFLKTLQAKSHKNWIKIIEFSQNKGPSSARNAGWDAATQPYVAFLDADDAWHPQKIEIQLKYMQINQDVAITGHRWHWQRGGRPLPYIPDHYTARPISRWEMLRTNSLATPTVMLKRDLSFRFNPVKRYSEDYLLWLRIICSGMKAGFINLDLAYLHKAPYGAGGMSAQLWAMERGELDNYRILHNDKLISGPSLIALSAFSMAKYMRRVMISKLRLIR